MRNLLALTIPVVTVMSLTGCSALEAYPTYPAVALAGEDPGPRVAMCYNAIVSNLDQVQAAAQQECAPNTRATLFQTERSLQYCPLLLPARATFLCTPDK
ncbi:MAG: hypothetical protein WBX30_15275 [Stellaceae bacterium]